MFPNECLVYPIIINDKLTTIYQSVDNTVNGYVVMDMDFSIRTNYRTYPNSYAGNMVFRLTSTFIPDVRVATNILKNYTNNDVVMGCSRFSWTEFDGNVGE